MELITRAIRGTQDVLPADSYKWQHVEQTALSIARDFGFREIRTPVFEHTELFQRSVGETTDVVQKEMYTFSDKGGRSSCVRPASGGWKRTPCGFSTASRRSAPPWRRGRR